MLFLHARFRKGYRDNLELYLKGTFTRINGEILTFGGRMGTAGRGVSTDIFTNGGDGGTSREI